MKHIHEWKRILIDTTVLCSLFRSEKSEAPYSQDLFVRKVIELLSTSKTSSGDNRFFLVSSVTIAELTTNEEDSEKIKRILRVLDSKNIEFVEFDIQVALAFNIQMKDKLNKQHLHKRAVEIGFKTNDFGMAREWITRDYMIAMCGIENGSDVILTADKNTFYPIIKDISNCNCVLTYPELLEVSDKFILRYKDNEVEDFLSKNLTPSVQKPMRVIKPETEETDSKAVVDSKSV